MEKAVALLRQELVILGRLAKLVAAQKTILAENLGDKASPMALAIENAMRELKTLQDSQSAYLAEHSAADWKGYLAGSPYSPQRKMAEDILRVVAERVVALKKAAAINRSLLDRDVDYVNFNINVITGVTAGTTYAAGGNQGEAGRDVKIFEGAV